MYLFKRSLGEWTQTAYVKASNADDDDTFGYNLDLSADGQSLVVGAADEEGAATGINGDQADNSSGSSGAVYLY